jgi:hypothetical protein
MNPFVIPTPDGVVQIPSRPLPVAAVEPAWGLVRLGSCSPLTAGVEAPVGELAVCGELAVDGADALLDEVGAGSEPPPPPQAVRTSEANRDSVNVALIFMFIFLFCGECGRSGPPFHAVSWD